MYYHTRRSKERVKKMNLMGHVMHTNELTLTKVISYRKLNYLPFVVY